MTEKWIQKAIKHKGALRKSLGVSAGEKIPAKKLEKAASAPGKLGQRARLAQTLSKMHSKTKKYAEGGTAWGRSDLKSDESRLAKWDQMTQAEKDSVRAKEKAALDAATSERSRPLTSRILDAGYRTFGSKAAAAANEKAANEDARVREQKYQEAKQKAARTDKDRDNERYGVDRKVKFAKGGSVRGVGCALRGHGKGTMR